MSKLPIGDTTLSAKEIIANESQERMGLLIQEEAIEHVRKVAEREPCPDVRIGERPATIALPSSKLTVYVRSTSP